MNGKGVAAGDKAGIVSPVIPGNVGQTKLTFWYYMYGDYVGRLSVFTQAHSPDTDRHMVWDKVGDQGQRWMKADINLDLKYNYSVRNYFIFYEMEI